MGGPVGGTGVIFGCGGGGCVAVAPGGCSTGTVFPAGRLVLEPVSGCGRGAEGKVFPVGNGCAGRLAEGRARAPSDDAEEFLARDGVSLHPTNPNRRD